VTGRDSKTHSLFDPTIANALKMQARTIKDGMALIGLNALRMHCGKFKNKKCL
jgi:hypothetical protein